MSRGCILVMCTVMLLGSIVSAGTVEAAGFVGTGSSMTRGHIWHTVTLLPDGKVLVAGGYDLSMNVLAPAELYDPATGTFTPGASMTEPRDSHSATMLPNGKVLIVGGVGLNGILKSSELYDPDSGTFSATGNMTESRTSHTATLLPNGKVLIAGGYGPSGRLGSAELYDPADGTFSAVGSMAVPRIYHTASLLPNGKVLVAGGEGSDYAPLNSAELYDPATGTFAPAGSMTMNRKYHTATLLPSGKVLVAGGEGNGHVSLNSAELYDPATGSFSLTGNLASARFSFAATLLADGKVLVCGGEIHDDVSSPGSYHANAEVYDPETGLFSGTGSLAFKRSEPAAVLLANGRVLVVGGTVVGSTGRLAELYDPAAGAFSSTGSMTTKRTQHSATRLADGKVLIAGGKGANNEVLSSAEIYDPTTGTFGATGSMSSPRSNQTATLLPNGKVLLAGGQNGTTNLRSADLYDPASGTFTPTGTMTYVEGVHTATLLFTGKVLMVRGGTAELYDPQTGTFSVAGNLNTARQEHSATLLAGGKVLVTGGADTAWNPLDSAELYDPTTGLFSPTGSMVSKRQEHVAVLLANGKVLIAGGFGQDGIAYSAEVYDPITGTFSPTGSMIPTNIVQTATLLPNGKVLVNGFSELYTAVFELYDPDTGLFTATSTLVDPSFEDDGYSTTLLDSGKVLVAGGYDYKTGPKARAELYDPAPLPTIAGIPPATATTGLAYRFTPISTNDADFAVSCPLPPGVAFSTATGSLQGVPTAKGVYGPIVITARNANGTASLPPFTLTVEEPVVITGKVTSPSGAGIAGVAFTGASCTVTAASGAYSCIVSPGWNGTITPSRAGFAFTPPRRLYPDASSNRSGQDYAAAPPAPAVVTPAPGDGRVTLGWSPVAGASSYNLYYATTPGTARSAGLKRAGVQNPAEVAPLVNGTSYYFVVTTVVDGIESAASAEVAAVPAPAAATPTLTGLWTETDAATPASVNENGSIRFTARAAWSDGTTSSVVPVWSVTPGTCAAIDADGLLTAQSVTANRDVTVKAVYSSGDRTLTATRTVTVVNVTSSLVLTVSGTGAGSVNSDPAGLIACTYPPREGICTAELATGTSFALLIQQSPTTASVLLGSECGNCSGGACKVTLDSDRTCSIGFTAAPKAKIGSTGYDTLAAAYGAVADGETIRVLDAELAEGLTMNRGKNVTIAGGYNALYSSRTGNPSVLVGELVVGGSDCLTADRLAVR